MISLFKFNTLLISMFGNTAHCTSHFLALYTINHDHLTAMDVTSRRHLMAMFLNVLLTEISNQFNFVITSQIKNNKPNKKIAIFI